MHNNCNRRSCTLYDKGAEEHCGAATEDAEAPKLCGCGNKKQENGVCDSCAAPTAEDNAYGEVNWRADDVKYIHPDWSLKKCEKELAKISGALAGALVSRGWEMLEDLLPA